MDPVGYQLRTTTGGKGDGWKDLSDERKAAYSGAGRPYLLEIDRETAAP